MYDICIIINNIKFLLFNKDDNLLEIYLKDDGDNVLNIQTDYETYSKLVSCCESNEKIFRISFKYPTNDKIKYNIPDFSKIKKLGD